MRTFTTRNRGGRCTSCARTWRRRGWRFCPTTCSSRRRRQGRSRRRRRCKTPSTTRTCRRGRSSAACAWGRPGTGSPPPARRRSMGRRAPSTRGTPMASWPSGRRPRRGRSRGCSPTRPACRPSPCPPTAAGRPRRASTR
ncbi:hypothetical protein BU14_2688s0001 [Porphyra umbilicalis]|uniref:Uncharacterized protein n=1 Tax=Porphyra umbilicalis TaxID=2786 RepID=A0A1X6NIQ2_PORUM|nr:hypothetical protein BU14_2688s0001 [Porphyra umbilicalis]|eukprot:OSX68498.1 hypothetical protein BU14_2688s0001 [Porphyra umbilicalis]